MNNLVFLALLLGVLIVLPTLVKTMEGLENREGEEEDVEMDEEDVEMDEEDMEMEGEDVEMDEEDVEIDEEDMEEDVEMDEEDMDVDEEGRRVDEEGFIPRPAESSMKFCFGSFCNYKKSIEDVVTPEKTKQTALE